MTAKDPERLSAPAGNAELRELIRAGQARSPDVAAIERMRARIDNALPTSSAPSGGRTLGFKIPTLVVASAVLVAGLTRLSHPRRAPELPPGASVVASATGEPLSGRTENPAEIVREAEPAPIATNSAPPARRARPTPSSAATIAEPAPPAAPATATELQLIGTARRALKSEPARALALTNEHQRLYPAGTLTEEREVIAIEALARLGSGALARARADHFSVSFPHSAHLSRIARAIGDSGAQKNQPSSALDE